MNSTGFTNGNFHKSLRQFAMMTTTSHHFFSLSLFLLNSHIQSYSHAHIHTVTESERYTRPGVCRSFRSLSMWFLANMQYVTNKCKQKWLHHNSRVITRKMELFHLPCHFSAKFCTYVSTFYTPTYRSYTFTCAPTHTHVHLSRHAVYIERMTKI